jgi:hypothetical protein
MKGGIASRRRPTFTKKLATTRLTARTDLHQKASHYDPGQTDLTSGRMAIVVMAAARSATSSTTRGHLP